MPVNCAPRGGLDPRFRGVAQSGSAPALGAGCRGFESLHPDQLLPVMPQGRGNLRVRAADSLLALLDGGCSSPGRAPDCGSGGSGFETRQPPHLASSRINSGCASELSVTRLCNLLTDGVVHNEPNLFEVGYLAR